ncbi:hypothetical protein KNU02_gp15 [Gordonia phage Pleakley]|uniref:Uncharacterized protein n=1 Tax=Gordonia phage Pleakley TaxID=2283246 RepID=A0A345M6D3_9CAUD|nr:hypothetical protein KNU02_gp15 [Gordonia phage Pleakley]AXH49741.1 hypothetical protein SEA_FURY_15 [Gordonia phage Fury]AXH66054.1 hypothetical protein SEA_PLEAKLEY_15 [Gordonia phage Pleakley]
MRFVEEYAVEWVRQGQFGREAHFDAFYVPPKTLMSEPTRDKQVALKAIDMLSKRNEIILARLMSRTVREEKRWWHLTWVVTGITRWFDWTEQSWMKEMQDV